MKSQPVAQYYGKGNALVRLALVMPLSASVTVPRAFLSFKKLAAEAGCESWALTTPDVRAEVLRDWRRRYREEIL